MLAQLTLDPVEHHDLIQRPIGMARILVSRFIKFSSCMGPAAGQLEMLFITGEAGISRVGIALEDAAKVDGQNLI